jgi:transposase
VSLTGGNRNDVTQLLPLPDKIPAVAGMVGRPRHRPDILFADRGYDHDKYRRLLRERCIRPVIAEREQPHGTGLGTSRWVVEPTISWLHGFRRLRIRWERRDDIHEAFLGLAVCLITHRHVQRLCEDQLAHLAGVAVPVTGPCGLTCFHHARRHTTWLTNDSRTPASGPRRPGAVCWPRLPWRPYSPGCPPAPAPCPQNRRTARRSSP